MYNLAIVETVNQEGQVSDQLLIAVQGVRIVIEVQLVFEDAKKFPSLRYRSSSNSSTCSS